MYLSHCLRRETCRSTGFQLNILMADLYRDDFLHDLKLLIVYILLSCYAFGKVYIFNDVKTKERCRYNR